MRFMTRSIVALVMLAVTLALLALAGHTVLSALQARWADKAVPRPVRERVFAATVVSVTPQTVIPELAVYGEVRARRVLELRAPRGGRVIWLAEGFEDGASVQAGQVLMRVDPSDARAARDLALADQARAEAEARDAARALDLAADDLLSAQAQAELRRAAAGRQTSLRERGIGSDAAQETADLAVQQADQAVLSRRQSLITAEARIDQAAVALQRLAITLAEAERALSETELVAGFSGRLSDVAVTEGGLVGQNERLGQIIDPDSLEVAARVSTAQYARLTGADGALLPVPVTAALDVAGIEITASGRLLRSAAAVGEGQAGRLVYAALDPAPGLRPGDFVTLRLPEPELQDVVVLPAAALGNDGTVLALAEGERLAAIPVTLLRRQGDQVILRAPELAGREVVAERTSLLGAGLRVRPLRPGDAAAVAPAAPPAEELVELTPERRAALVALVEGNARLPGEARQRILAQLAQDRVPAGVIARLETRRGG